MENLKKALLTSLMLLFFGVVTMAQDAQIKMQNVTVKQAITELKAKTGYSFVVVGNDLDTQKRVSVNSSSLKEIIEQIISGQDVTYSIDGTNIIIKKKTASESNEKQSNAGKHNIKGTIVDNSGGPIIGASIMLKGTSIGTISDIDGNFNLVASSNDVLNISYIGFKGQQIEVGSRSNFHIVLLEDSKALDEVIVIGYGTAKRKDFAGSVSSMNLESSPVSIQSNNNVLESLKGTITGLDVGATNSTGGTPTMQVRGQNSISGSNDPLLVVDGVIFMGKINDINPNDIASVDVLKDASSAAVYGSRAANGVIAITTKKGAIGKPVISFNVSNSFELWANKPTMVTPEQWIDWTMKRNGYTDTSFLSGQSLANYNAGKTVDWQDMVSQTGYLQDYSAAISGATEGMNYYFSTSYTNNKGIIVGDKYKRITIKGKFDSKITDWLKVGADASYARSDYSGTEANMFNIQIISPYGTPYNSLGGIEKYPNETQANMSPLWGVNSDTQDNADIANDFRLNAFAEITIPQIKGLSYRLNYSGTSLFQNANNFQHESYFVQTGAWNDENRYSSTTLSNYLGQANGYDSETRITSWVLDNILTYSHAFGKHQLDLTAVATRDSRHYLIKTMRGTDYTANGNTILGVNGLAYATTQKIERDATKQNNIGYLGRIAYNYANAYYFTASYRRDGSSVFGVNTKWGDFYSIGGAWRITNEKFMKRYTFLNDMKLKLSWGRNGNQGVAPYSTLSKVNTGATGDIYTTFGNNGTIVYGINQSNLGNRDLGWETTEAWNIGLESTWLNSRLTLNLDFYLSKTFDQLFNRTIPAMTGFTTVMASMGEVQNTGIEMTVSSLNIDKKDFKWNTALTFWLNRDKLKHLYNEDLNGDGKEDDDLGNQLFIGKSIHSIYGLKQIGVVQEEDVDYMKANGVKAGTPKYEDHDHNGVISITDRYIIGNTTPSFKLNLSNAITYKNWQLYCMISGTFGGGGYYLAENKKAFIYGGDGTYFGVNAMYVPYWTPENRSNTYLAPTYTGDDYFLGLKSRTYVKLQDISLSYTFKGAWMKNIGIKNMKMYLSAKNIITLTGWKGGDPEMSTFSDENNNILPAMKSVSFGLNVTL